MSTKTHLFIYRMTADSGLAPCIEEKLLSLACCKGGRKDGVHTGIRYWIGRGKYKNIEFDYKKDNVYILGIYKNKFLYLAKITEVMSMTDYFSDNKYKNRLDDIYNVKDGKLIGNRKLTKENIHCDKEQQARDIAGKYVLLSDEYIYLGKDSKPKNKFTEKYPNHREVKYYSNNEAQEIINWCYSINDNLIHKPTDILRKSCKQR